MNPLTPNDPYWGRTAPLTSKSCILYIYSRNLGTEYFKHVTYSPFFPSSKCSLFHNSNVFSSCFINILYTECAKINNNNSGAERLNFFLQSTRNNQYCTQSSSYLQVTRINIIPSEYPEEGSATIYHSPLHYVTEHNRLSNAIYLLYGGEFNFKYSSKILPSIG